MIFSLVYTSTAVQELSRAELLGFLLDFRVRNQARGITGILLYRDGAILQCLEGEQAAVLEIYGKIQTDHRHRDVRTVWVSLRAHRQFPDWTMGFRDLLEEPIEQTGYSQLLDRSGEGTLLLRQPKHVEELLELLGV